MFNQKLRQRIEKLESQLTPIVTERNCALGHHEWEIIEIKYTHEPPYARCKNCYKKAS